MIKVLVAIADEIEELETIGIADMLDRAGAEVTLASVDQLQISASHHTKIIADKLIADCQEETYDLIVCPGGMPGAEYLSESKILIEMLRQQKNAGKWYAAICASPVVVLQKNGLIGDKLATAYPSMAAALPNQKLLAERVVVDGNCVTAQGAGVVMEFSLKLIELLFGAEKAAEIKKSMLIC
ncbi:MAG: DJ-1/PfpI family protein [Candidatus Cloacimonadales bacterium]